MVTAREIKGRIESIGNVKKITSTMKAVASAKLGQVQDRMQRSRPFAKGIHQSIEEVISRNQDIQHSYIYDDPETGEEQTPEDEKPGYLVIAGDRGLCGSYNQNVFRKVQNLVASDREEKKSPHLYLVGSRAADFFSSRDVSVQAEFQDIWDELSYERSLKITHRLVDDFELGDITSIDIIYTEFETAMTQHCRRYHLLPFHREKFLDPDSVGTVDFKYEPDAQSVINHLFPRHVRVQVYQAMLESFASEQGSRMVAMDNATENATEMIDDLTLEFNQARQASITQEIAEISGGAEALRES